MKIITFLHRLLLVVIVSGSFQAFSQNLLVNGGFESGGAGVGFNTNYNLYVGPGNSAPRQYSITTNASTMNSNFGSATDYPTGAGKMMVVDGSNSASDKVWELLNGSSIGVISGRTYEFTYYIRSISSQNTIANSAIIDVNTNGTTTIPQLMSGPSICPVGNPSPWTKVMYRWTATTNNAQIWLTDAQTTFAGNDFAIDNLSLVDIASICSTPTFTVTQPTCPTPTGTVTFTSPLNLTPAPTPPTDLFISEVTDESTGSLSYIEIYNGTGVTKNLTNYKIKVYNNGNPGPSLNCDIPLLGLLAHNDVFVISFGSLTNQGSVVPDMVANLCPGFNDNDNVRLTTSADVLVDLWGRTDGVSFTPANQPGYTYRRLANSPHPNTVWNPADWTALDPQDYTDVGNYLMTVYEYSLNSTTYQSSPIFSGLPPNTTYNNATIRDVISGCVSIPVSITIDPISPSPLPTVLPITYCQNAAALPLTATPATGGTLNWYGTNATGGTASATAPTPSTTGAPGSFIPYYVSQTIAGCESLRAEIRVYIGHTALPGESPVLLCDPANTSDTQVAFDFNNVSWDPSPIYQTNWGYIYSINGGPPVTGTLPNAAGGHLYIPVSSPGTPVTLTVTWNGICGVPTRTRTCRADCLVTPVLSIHNPAAVCPGSTVDITQPAVTTGSTGSGTLSYWADSNATIPLSFPANAIPTAGTYYIKSSLGNCYDIESVIVAFTTAPAVPTVNTTAPTCSANGSTTITNYSAANTYAFSPTGPTAGTGGTITGAVLGTAYTVTASNATCTSAASTSFTNLAQLPTPAAPALNTISPTCSANGSTIITNYNAANTYTFTPAGPTAGAGGTITGAVIGTPYTVTATNGGCTSVTASFTNQTQFATPAVPTLSTTAPTCSANGFTTITNYNAANTYTFTPTGPTVGAGGTISGAVIGTAYTVKATSTGCVSAASTSFTNQAQLPTPAVPTLSTTAPTCAANGFTTITNYNAANTYTFTPVGPAVGAGGTISGAVIGTAYTVKSTNGGCTSAASLSFTNQSQLPTPAVPTISTTAPTCSANGSTTITNYNAANTYTFTPAGPTAGAGGSISGAVIGTAYTVKATSTGCVSAASASFTNQVQLPTPAVPTLSTTPPTCTVNGFTTITNYNAANTYTFTPAGPTAGAGGTISGATIGTAYTVKATNGGCTSASSPSFTNLGPSTPATPTLNTTAPTCTANGSTTITNYNPAYTYTFSPSGPNVIVGGTITATTIGTAYTVTATNGGCTSASSSPFTNLSILPALIIPTPQPLQNCDPDNNGYSTFDLTQVINTITGGNPGYTVTFHETPDDANIGGTTIPVPTSYDNINPWLQTIYVRVTSITSTCFQIVNLQLIVNPTPEAIDPADYELCDYTGAAHYEAFDLTSTIPQILGSINPATVTVTFYTNLPDAQTPSNAITSVTAYTNGTPDTETLYVRVEFIATGCFDIVPLTLVVNPLPNSTQPNYPQYSLCDNDQSNIGYEIFDLGSKINDILLGQTGMDVTFYISLGDAQNGTGLITSPGLMYMNQIQYVQTLGIRITNTDTGCYVISTMDIRVEPLPTLIAPTSPYTLCDEDQDGFTTFDLTTLLPGLLGGITTYTVSFHETLPDAELNGTTIPNPAAYTNINPFIQTIYVRTEDNITHCVSYMPLELNVDPSPIAPVFLPNIITCDDDSNTQDASTAVDLTQQTAAVLALQPLAGSNYIVTYYNTQLAAESPSGAGQIIPETNYVGTNGETIWVRVENVNTHCFNVGSFQLEINIPLLLTTPTPLNVCDDDANPNDLFHVFDLTVKDLEVNMGTGYVVTYYPSLLDAQNNTSVITTPTAYQNIIPAVQTLGAIVTTPAGCQSIITMDIRVLPIPTPNTNPPALAPKCDDNNPGDMMEFFDLTVNAAYIINGDPTLTLHYYHSLADAQVPQNEIAIPANALVGDVDPNEQSVWIRVENNRVDYLGNNCYVLVEQPLTVNPLPAVNPSPDPFRVCDNDTDGIAQFDLTDPLLAPQVLDTATTGQQPADYTITYYLTPADAASGTSPLASPYTNLTNPQDIYIRVVNNATGCVNATGILSLAVEQYATATGPQYFSQCDDYADPYDGIHEIDLTQYEAAILNGQNPAVFLVSYYTTQQDAIDGTNPLSAAEAAAYHNDPPLTDTIWVKVENTGNTITPVCYAITTIEINVEPYPNPVINTPNGVNTICVDFITNAVVRDLTLDAGMAVPSDYTYQWFEAGDPTTVIGTGPTYWVNTSAAGGATRTYTVLVTSNTPLACATTSAPFDVIQSGQAVIPAGSVGYTVTDAFSASQVVTVTVTGYGTYEYSLDDGPRQTSNVFENVSLGTHIIHVWDTEGGVAFSCEELIIEEVQIIDYPHYFTPNGDGIHDTWNIVGLGGQPGAKIYIFDRYGKLLKQISSKGQGWDGTFNGHMLPSDDYWFTVDFEENSTIKQFKAHFTLKR